MSYDLLTQPWIPVLTRSGKNRLLTPADALNAHANDPAAAIAHPRADLTSGIHEFLFALVQTALSPANEDEWEDLHSTIGEAPSRDALVGAFASLDPQFDLVHPEHPYMQEVNLPNPRTLPIDNLLIDTPATATIDDGKDVFQHRRHSPVLCHACAAAAIHTLQVFAPSGGRGHRTSPRGGGPVSVRVVGDTLWEAVWSLVLPRARFAKMNGLAPTAAGARFLWQAPKSELAQWQESGIHASGAHPDAVLWPISRRLRLIPSQPTNGATCAACGEGCSEAFSSYQDQSYGVDYLGPWMHPLTPFSVIDGARNTVKANIDFASFRNYAALVYGSSRWNRPPSIVAYASRLNKLERSSFVLHISGYDMDSAKVKGWLEAALPAHAMNDDRLVAHREHLQAMVDGADRCASELTKRVKLVWFQGKAPKQDAGTTNRLRHELHRAFFKLENLAAALDGQALDDLVSLRAQWRGLCIDKALEIFDQVSITRFVTDQNPRIVVEQRSRLKRALWGKPIREVFRLNPERPTRPTESKQKIEAIP